MLLLFFCFFLSRLVWLFQTEILNEQMCCFFSRPFAIKIDHFSIDCDGFPLPAMQIPEKKKCLKTSHVFFFGSWIINSLGFLASHLWWKKTCILNNSKCISFEPSNEIDVTKRRRARSITLIRLINFLKPFLSGGNWYSFNGTEAFCWNFT